MHTSSAETMAVEIDFDDTVPKVDQDILSAALRQHAESVTQLEKRSLTVASVLVILKVITAAGGATAASAGAVAAVYKAAAEIKKWRDDARAKKMRGNVKLRRKGKTDLNLLDTKDEDIDQWFQM